MALCALSFSAKAEAGTLLKTRTCTMTSGGCDLFFNLASQPNVFSCYGRFAARGRGPYPLHNAVARTFYTYEGVLTTSQVAFSPNGGQCLPANNLSVSGYTYLAPGTPITYDLQLWAGTY